MRKQQAFIAFYKHKVKIKNWRTFKEWVIDQVIRLATRSQYSHCELVISRNDDSGLFDCYSSSPRDGGVRKKTIKLLSERWDILCVDISAHRVKRTFKKYVGKKYDFLGAIGFFCGKHAKDKYFCSEYCAEILKLDNTLISPQQLYEQLTR